MRWLFILGALAVVWIAPAAAGAIQATSVSPPAQSAPASPEKDVVVTGIPIGPFQTTADPNPNADISIFSRQAADDAHFFSRCVKPFDNPSLHELIDGQPNRYVREAALDRIVKGYQACYRGFGLDGDLRDYGTCNPRPTDNPLVIICQSFFDRGALIEHVLATYAPDLAFTPAELAAPRVFARYRVRQDRFDKTRSKNERIYAEVAGCAVALHPELALAYLRSAANSRTEDSLRVALLGQAGPCLGGATRVAADPAQLRVFVADAVYSWAVALKGTTSLIPFKPGSSALP